MMTCKITLLQRFSWCYWGKNVTLCSVFCRKFNTTLEKKAPLFIIQIIEFGGQVRSTGATGVNADSSRSHAILQLEVKVVNTAESVGKYVWPGSGTHCCGPHLLWCSPGVKPHSSPSYPWSSSLFMMDSTVACCHAPMISQGLSLDMKWNEFLLPRNLTLSSALLLLITHSFWLIVGFPLLIWRDVRGQQMSQTLISRPVLKELKSTRVYWQ